MVSEGVCERGGKGHGRRQVRAMALRDGLDGVLTLYSLPEFGPFNSKCDA
jgi:hypothetical protein